MRNRSFALNTIEVIVPVVVAVVLGLGAFLFLTPVFGQGHQADPGVIRIYSSVPMDQFASITHGVQMAIDEAGGRVGNYKIDYVPLNDAAHLERQVGRGCGAGERPPRRGRPRCNGLYRHIQQRRGKSEHPGAQPGEHGHDQPR